MLHGPQRDIFDLEFALPAECADRLANGRADIGIVPVAALLDQDLAIFRGTGIACRGAVRTILLASKRPLAEIRRLATDSSSRSSVRLARVVLAHRYSSTPTLISMAPDLDSMLQSADAGLVIGDPALRLDPDALRGQGLFVADLGEEWMALSGLPMVFAVWAGRREGHNAAYERAFVDSYRFGAAHIDDIVRAEHAARGVTAGLAHAYLTRHIVFELGETEYAGMRRFLEYAAALEKHEPVENLSV
jgi:chorismate dehydratase